jgi:putative peptidoglycan lipid II flippase
VGSGILSSRVVGLVRERIFAHYFGNSAAADAFKAALKIPNILQNLFGEGALSSSFIPVYARLLASGDRREAARVARVVGSLLALAMSLLVLAGMLATPLLIDLIAPGFSGEKREATIRMVRIVFPGIGLLVLSAWCLGILNSHRRFFLPYAAPVLWNLAMIGTLVGFGGREDPYRLAEYLAWGSVAGSLLQFGVQLPAVLRLAGEIHFQWDVASAQVRTVIRNFIPGMATRGVNQVSSAIDTILASFLPTGAVAALAYTQTLYLIPVSLFGMSISSAELPEMSSQLGARDTVAEGLRLRLDRALERVAFFVVPSAAAFLALGDSVIGLLYQTGEFTLEDTRFVWAVLAGYTTGLLAATLGRLYTSAFWALGDTRTPFRYAAIRISTAAGLGWFLAFPVPAWLGLPARVGLVGLTAAAGLAAWVEFSLLRRALIRRIGRASLALPRAARLSGAALAAAAAAYALKLWLRELPPYISGSLVLAVFGSLYLAAAAALGMPDAVRIIRAVRKRMPFRAG